MRVRRRSVWMTVAIPALALCWTSLTTLRAVEAPQPPGAAAA